MEVDTYLNTAMNNVNNVNNERKMGMEEHLRKLRALDFRAPERIMIDKIEGKMWLFFNDTALNSGYNYREGQYDMAEGVLNAIRHGMHLAVEAGVGIGKSYGYLVPLLLYHRATRKPIVIATSTIALQEQLAEDLENLMDLMGVDMPFIVAKGQGNYICIRRAKKYIDRWGETYAATQIAEGLLCGFADRKEYPPDLSDKDWNAVNIRKYKKKECGLCAHSAKCQYFQMRQELPEAGIVICNQDLLIAHYKTAELYNSYLLNPGVSVIVIDEAYNLEGKARIANTVRISAKNILRIAKGAELSVIAKDDQGISRSLQYLMDSVGTLFSNVRKQAIEQNKDELKKLSDATRAAGQQYSNDELFKMLEIDKFFFKDVDDAFLQLRQMISCLDALVKFHSSPRKGWNLETEQLEEEKALRDCLTKFERNMDRYVLWSERSGNDWSICFCPKNIAGVCSKLFFQGKCKVILTSATMTGLGTGSDAERYAYWAKGIGFPKEMKDASTDESVNYIFENRGFGSYISPIPSPFRYDEHAMIYYTNDLPHPTKEHESFLKEGINRLREILNISEGRALVLFTSKSDMYRVAKELRNMVLPFTILVQGSGSSQKDIIDAFREDEHAVLLGTGSFWEGISVEGATLSNLVIFRLPFAVPDPITAEKEAGVENPLMEIRVPEMIIKLKQGVGRLIRNEEDKGIVSIIDSRMGDGSTVPYKQQVWDALPIKNRTSNLDEIRRFYREVVMPGILPIDGQPEDEKAEDEKAANAIAQDEKAKAEDKKDTAKTSLPIKEQAEGQKPEVGEKDTTSEEAVEAQNDL